MLLVAIAWLYVVLMVTVVQASGRHGSLLSALFTFVLYGVLPLSILGYLYFSPTRRRARRVAEALSAEAAGFDPDRGGHASSEAVAPKRKEP